MGIDLYHNITRTYVLCQDEYDTNPSRTALEMAESITLVENATRVDSFGFKCPDRQGRGPAMFTIQSTPNLSFSIPNASPQGAFSSGMVIVPPAESFSK